MKGYLMNKKIEVLKEKAKFALPFVVITATYAAVAGLAYYYGRISVPDQMANLHSQWDAKIASVPETDVVFLARNDDWIIFRPTS